MSDKFTLVRAPLNMNPLGTSQSLAQSQAQSMAQSQAQSMAQSQAQSLAQSQAQAQYDKCRYAFFPGCCLCAQEPEIVAKTYDALLFQNPDTAIFIQCCDDVDEIRQKWNELGKPEMIICCSECRQVFAEKLPEIPVASLYDKFLEYEISGGCNSVDYCLHESVYTASGNSTVSSDCADTKFTDCAVAKLAEDMGVTLHEHEDNSPFPYLVGDINVRNSLKESGHDAAHIMELMFGMGASNTHLIHEHDHGEETGGTEVPDLAEILKVTKAPDVAKVPDVAKAPDVAKVPGETELGSAIEEALTECDGNCAACAGCHDKPHPPQPLPDEAQQEANRLELKEVLLALYWNQL